MSPELPIETLRSNIHILISQRTALRHLYTELLRTFDGLDVDEKYGQRIEIEYDNFENPVYFSIHNTDLRFELEFSYADNSMKGLVTLTANSKAICNFALSLPCTIKILQDDQQPTLSLSNIDRIYMQDFVTNRILEAVIEDLKK
jgi:hypothetical protein